MTQRLALVYDPCTRVLVGTRDSAIGMKASFQNASLAFASFAAACWPAAAVAEPSDSSREGAIDLEWNAPAQCPTREVFLAELASALGSASRGRVPCSTRIDIASAGDEGWKATVYVAAQGVSSERVLHAENCQTLASAAAVIAAVAMEAPTGDPPLTGARAIAPPAGSADHETLLGTRSRKESQLIASAAAILDDGTLPAPSPGVEGTVAWALLVAPLRARIEASGAVFETQGGEAQDHPAEGGRFSLLTVGGRVCGTRLFGPLEVGPCLGGELDLMNGSGTGTQAIPGRGYWGALDGSGLGSWSPTRGFALTVRVDGVFPLAPPSFVIRRVGADDIFVHRPALATLRMVAGIELRFF